MQDYITERVFRMKRIFLLFLTLVLCLTAFAACGKEKEQQSSSPESSEAEESIAESPAEDFKFTPTQRTLSVSKYYGSSKIVVIPKEYEGAPVTSIGALSFSTAKIMKLTIPESVTTISQKAFVNCRFLQEINFNNGVLSIGKNSFTNCSALKKLEAFDNLESIGEGAFKNCTSLESIVLPKSLKELGSEAFAGCTKLKQVTFLGDAPEILEADAFDEGTELTIYYAPGTLGWDSASLKEKFNLVPLEQ